MFELGHEFITVCEHWKLVLNPVNVDEPARSNLLRLVEIALSLGVGKVQGYFGPLVIFSEEVVDGEQNLLSLPIISCVEIDYPVLFEMAAKDFMEFYDHIFFRAWYPKHDIKPVKWIVCSGGVSRAGLFNADKPIDVDKLSKRLKIGSIKLLHLQE